MFGVVLAMLAMFVAAAAFGRYFASKGAAPTWRQRAVFALSALGVLFSGLALGAVSRGAAQPTPAEWRELAAVVVAVGFAPLVLFLAFDVPLRVVRRWETSRGV
jgi:hypothetical protein